MSMRIQSHVVGLMVKDLPKFNDKLIRGIREHEIGTLVDFICDRYEECIKVIGEDIVLTGARAVSPEERLEYELHHTGQAGKKTHIKIHLDEAALVKFEFLYEGKHPIEKYLYVPYIYEDNYVKIGKVRYDFLLSMNEKIFSCLADNGLTIKVIRSPISFWKNINHQFISLTNDNNTTYIENLISTKIHWKTRKGTGKALRPTIVHYMVCKFGLGGLLNKLGYDSDTITYTTVINEDDAGEYDYFKAQGIAVDKGPVMLRVKKDDMKDTAIRSIIGNLSYLLNGFRNISYDNLITDDITVYLILLGKIIYNRSTSWDNALRYMQKHLVSVDTYLDSYYKEIFNQNDIVVDDIYDLLIYIWFNMDDILIRYPNNNMYNKRLDTFHGAVIESFVTKLYKIIYKKTKRGSGTTHMVNYVRTVLGAFTATREILKNTSDMKNVRFNHAVCNDNWLLSIGDKVVKRLGSNNKYSVNLDSAVNRYHPSMLTSESAVGFSSSNPGLNCLLNPFAEIDSSGGFVQNELTNDADEMIRKNYLPK